MVDGESYRWVVSPDSGYAVLVIEHLKSPGQRVAVTIPPPEFKDTTDDKTEYTPEGYRVVTPALVRNVILDALAMGWSPQSSGKEIHLRLTPNERLASRT